MRIRASRYVRIYLAALDLCAYMASRNIHNPKAPPMAHITTSVPHSGNLISKFFQSIYSGLIHMAEANTRIAQVERLQDMTDEELAEKRIRREDIVRHVYRDVIYL